MKDITNLTTLKNKIETLAQDIQRKQLELYKTSRALSSICTHPTTIHKCEYFTGGYDYTSEERFWDECTICGAKLNMKVVTGSFG